MKHFSFLLFFITTIAFAGVGDTRFSKDTGEKLLVNSLSSGAIAPYCQMAYDNSGTLTAVSAAHPMPTSGGGGGGGGGGVVQQGAQDVTAVPWQTDLEQYKGAAFSASNSPSCRLTNGTSFVDPTQIRALSSGTDTVTVTGTVAVTGVSTAANQATAQTSFNSMVSSLSSIVTQTTGLATSALQTSMSTILSNILTALQGTLIVAQVDGTKATYSACTNLSALATTPTDLVTLTGSATKLIRLNRVRFYGTETTVTVRDILLVKHSTANTGGTSSAVTAVPNDSNSAAATGTVLAYTANPTLGNVVGNVRYDKVIIPATTGVNSTLPIEWDFGDKQGQSQVLRGIAQQYSFNLNGVTSGGGNFNVCLEWTEE